MKNFENILLRLKAELALAEDKEVAKILGMTPNAFTARKRRDVFPEEKLLALKSRRPDLNIDDTYILTGVRKNSPGRSTAELGRQLSKEQDGGPEGPLQQAYYSALSGLEEVRERRQPQMDDMERMLDGCSEEDFQLVVAMVRRMHRASLYDHMRQRLKKGAKA